jgi:uncharacterized repeat protein (TIGR03803 family)
LDPSGKGTLLHSFSGKSDGGSPFAGLLQDSQGNLFGATEYGGQCNRQIGCGTIFKMDSAGDLTTLYRFSNGADGSFPVGNLIADAKGNLYGTTLEGGNTFGACAAATGCGGIFELTSAGNFKVLHIFMGGADGSTPAAGLIQDTKGNFYGTTTLGGAKNQGTVFELTNTHQEIVLHSFCHCNFDGSTPVGNLVQDARSDLYGTTALGGSYRFGTVFKLDSSGHETVLHIFTGASDGGLPLAGLYLTPSGNLAGTAEVGGLEGGTMGWARCLRSHPSEVDYVCTVDLRRCRIRTA